DKIIRVWDWQTGKTLRTIRGEVGPAVEGKIWAMALSPDSRWLAAAGWTHQQCMGRCGDVRLYEFATGRLAAVLEGHVNPVDALAFSPDSRLLASGSKDLSAIIWDVQGQKIVQRLKGHKDYIFSIAFTPDGKRLVTGSFDNTLRLWSV